MADHQPTDDGTRYATIARFSGYCFGDDGSIWSRRVKGHAGHRGPWKRLNPVPDIDGYRRITLIGEGGRRVCSSVHALILEAFRGVRPADRPVARHLDGDPANNRLDNLAWGTHSENLADALAHGTLRPSGKPALTDEQVREIRREYAADDRWGKVMRLARKYGVSHTQIKRIVRGQRRIGV